MGVKGRTPYLRIGIFGVGKVLMTIVGSLCINSTARDGTIISTEWEEHRTEGL